MRWLAWLSVWCCCGCELAAGALRALQAQALAVADQAVQAAGGAPGVGEVVLSTTWRLGSLGLVAACSAWLGYQAGRTRRER